ncbi:MAG: hypothetical protein L6R45_22630 [Anaerolineae bacterium]|nr:hypothetical protein [Anaerolineae bacterium]
MAAGTNDHHITHLEGCDFLRHDLVAVLNLRHCGHQLTPSADRVPGEDHPAEPNEGGQAHISQSITEITFVPPESSSGPVLVWS